MNNGEMIISASVVAMVEEREKVKAKTLAAFIGLSEAMSFEVRTTGKKYSALSSFLSGVKQRLKMTR